MRVLAEQHEAADTDADQYAARRHRRPRPRPHRPHVGRPVATPLLLLLLLVVVVCMHVCNIY